MWQNELATARASNLKLRKDVAQQKRALEQLRKKYVSTIKAAKDGARSRLPRAVRPCRPPPPRLTSARARASVSLWKPWAREKSLSALSAEQRASREKWSVAES